MIPLGYFLGFWDYIPNIFGSCCGCCLYPRWQAMNTTLIPGKEPALPELWGLCECVPPRGPHCLTLLCLSLLEELFSCQVRVGIWDG